MQIITIKVNKVKFTVNYSKQKDWVGYDVIRNNKCLVASTTPIKQKDNVKMDIFRELSEAIGYEIRHEIKKLNN